jgi:nicotinate-nucleotide--dimethylbenzimidazole phosphoribosyltransferase
MEKLLVSSTIESTLAAIPREFPDDIATAARERWDSLTKPRGSLGLLEDAVVKLCSVQNDVKPRVNRQAIYVFCGDHGITAQGVSAYPSSVTREMALNFVRGGAAISVLCRRSGIDSIVIDAGIAGPPVPGTVNQRVANGTRDFSHEPAMTRDEATVAVERGIHLADEAAACYDLVGVGEMGIGNTTSAGALVCALTGAHPEQATGRGAGLDDSGLIHKREVIRRALRRADIRPTNPLDILAEFGGFEIAMMTGFLLGAAARKLPVVLDGFITGAAFLIARALHPQLARHLFFSHRSVEPGHGLVFASAEVQPLLDLSMRLGEGTGAALAMGLISAAVALYSEMATFAQASVSDRTQ